MNKSIPFILLIASTMLWAQEKPNIAILELEGSGVSQQDLQGLTNRLQTEFFQTEKFTVLERSKINEVLEEQQFQMTGCTDLACAIEIGRLLNVEYVVIGNVDKVASIYSVNLRLVDVTTGEIIKNEFEDCPQCSLDEVFLRALKNATHKIAGIEVKPVAREIPKTQDQTSAQTVPPAQDRTPVRPTVQKKPKSSSQFRMGYFVGLQSSTSLNQERSYTTMNHAGGFSVGMTYEMPIYKKLFLKPEMVYEQRKAEWDYAFSISISDNRYKTNKLNYIHIPLLLSYHFSSNYSIFLGPSFGFWMGGSYENEYDVENDYEKGDYNSGLNRFILGTETKLGPLYFGYRYAIDLGPEEEYYKASRNIQYLTLGILFNR